MKKYLNLIIFQILCVCFATVAQTQPTPVTTEMFYFDSNHEWKERDGRYASDTYLGFSQLWLTEKSGVKWLNPIRLGVQFNTPVDSVSKGLINSYSKQIAVYTINNSTRVKLIAQGINPANYQNYRYRVIENDSAEIVPWSPIPLEIKHGAKIPYGFLGNYHAPGKQLVIEVINTKNYADRDGMVLNWRHAMTPVVKNIQVGAFHTGFSLYDKDNHGLATKFDKRRIPLDLKFPPENVAGIDIYLKPHPTVSYDPMLLMPEIDKPIHIRSPIIEDSFTLGSEYMKSPGKYKLILHPVGGTDAQDLIIPYEVLAEPAMAKKIPIQKVIAYGIIVTIVIGLIFLIYYRRNRAKLRRAAQDKQTAGLKLNSIRAQLNPHFMFNALTSIQNLVNKNDITGANHYLTKFAGLTRKVLDTGADELISLDEEIQLLDDYLQMEQLRFGFKYDIKADPQLNQSNTEIPAMLLQPFVENAIKHGISALHEKGEISIKINQEGQDILLAVTDNGPGFDENNQRDGYGLKLSNERAALLSQLHKDQPVVLHIDTQKTGTTVSIRLTNWV